MSVAPVAEGSTARRPASGPRLPGWVVSVVVPVLSVLMALGLWELISRTDTISQHDLPAMTTTVQALWSMILVLTGSLGSRGAQLYSDLLTFTSFASLLFNALTVWGLFVLRRKQPDLARPYRAPAYPWIPMVYLAVALFFLVFIAIGDPRNSGLGFAIMLTGVPVYFYLRAQDVSRVRTGSEAG